MALSKFPSKMSPTENVPLSLSPSHLKISRLFHVKLSKVPAPKIILKLYTLFFILAGWNIFIGYTNIEIAI